MSHRTYFFVVNSGVQNILDCCISEGVTSLVYTSSESAVIGYSNILNGDETFPYPEPGELLVGEYANTKQIAERMLLKSDGTNTNSGKSCLRDGCE